MTQPILRLHPHDDVVVALRDLPKNTAFCIPDSPPIQTQETIPIGHKIAIRERVVGESVRKYGEVIGVATAPIQPGSWVHCHNIRNPSRDVWSGGASAGEPFSHSTTALTFNGIVRADGTVGTRNYIAIVSSVNCSATVAHRVARRFDRDALSAFPNIDGVIALSHPTGCGMPRQGLHYDFLRRVMSGIRVHPNIAACLVIGLGCEQTPAREVLEPLPWQVAATAGDPEWTDPRDSKAVVMQECGGTRQTIDRAAGIVSDWLPLMNQVTRQAVSASHLVLATECGGSDAFSGITANPALGCAVDQLVAQGGTAVLSETSEVAGAEQILLRRAVDDSVRQTLLERLEWWEWYAGVFGAELDHNPSGGNKAGGLSTITEKSLGAVLKGGSSPLQAVIEYAKPIPSTGLVFMDTPGFDPPSVTGMVAGGATIVCFTTGRGSCFGCPAAPTIKIASNSRLATTMADDVDINAGVILDGTSLEEVGSQILQEVLAVAGGKRTRSEQQGYGEYEWVPWHIGPVL